ncbi:MAG: BrnA antitoxin family protein [Burkholderiaceae bacterium]
MTRKRGSGPGWQTRMNEALKDWLRKARCNI